ncbi:MAG: response regulator [Candidatus Kerfeldbacteria bacterium]|nr:response regulator [Candidatus Kerfeldbacteria bacterium]
MEKTKVLVIEDERMLAEMYSTKFAMEGFEVDKAFDGSAGLQKAKTVNPDVILLDIILPKLDGFAVLKEIRKDERLKKTPVLLLTNLGQDDDIKKGKELGADDYFVKSNHTPADVVIKVKELLARPRP